MRWFLCECGNFYKNEKYYSYDNFLLIFLKIYQFLTDLWILNDIKSTLNFNSNIKSTLNFKLLHDLENTYKKRLEIHMYI